MIRRPARHTHNGRDGVGGGEVGRTERAGRPEEPWAMRPGRCIWAAPGPPPARLRASLRGRPGPARGARSHVISMSVMHAHAAPAPRARAISPLYTLESRADSCIRLRQEPAHAQLAAHAHIPDALSARARARFSSNLHASGARPAGGWSIYRFQPVNKEARPGRPRDALGYQTPDSTGAPSQRPRKRPRRFSLSLLHLYLSLSLPLSLSQPSISPRSRTG